MPQLQDPNFEKSVVLMVEHNAAGSMGIVINRQSKLTIGELGRNQHLAVSQLRENQPICVGGPVDPYRGFVLHDSTEVEERTELLPGLFLSVTSEALAPLLQNDDATLRLCLGYAGWGAGQVERELELGSWLFTEASTEVALSTESGQIWNRVIKGMGFDPGWLVTTGGMN